MTNISLKRIYEVQISSALLVSGTMEIKTMMRHYIPLRIVVAIPNAGEDV